MCMHNKKKIKKEIIKKTFWKQNTTMCFAKKSSAYFLKTPSSPIFPTIGQTIGAGAVRGYLKKTTGLLKKSELQFVLEIVRNVKSTTW